MTRLKAMISLILIVKFEDNIIWLLKDWFV